MTFRDEQGVLTGFSIEVARAVCRELGVECEWVDTTFQQVGEELKSGRLDMAAMSLMATPERRSDMLFARPYFRSLSVLLSRPGTGPGQPRWRVVVVEGSAQAQFAQARNWQLVPVATNIDLPRPLLQKQADAVLAPMMTAWNLMKQTEIQKLGLTSQVMPDEELSGPASFGISPKRPELKPQVDAALDKLQRNGVMDRLSSQFLPFKAN